MLAIGNNTRELTEKCHSVHYTSDIKPDETESKSTLFISFVISMNTSELLLSKENIQPLRRGRDAGKLCVGLQAQTDTDAASLLQKQRL